jgi:hypothetical protein
MTGLHQCFQQARRADAVHIDVPSRFVHRLAYPDGCGLVKDGLDPMLPDSCQELIDITHIPLYERRLGGEVLRGLTRCSVNLFVKVVVYRHLVSLGE